MRTAILIALVATPIAAQRMAPTYASLQSFIDTCPQNDPYYPVIRRDFQILRDGAPVGDIPCTEPYSKLPAAQVTEELTAVQALRFAYYMDTGRSEYLPWTPLRLYDWFRSRVAGFNIDSKLDANTIAAACCSTINGRLYIVESTITDDFNRMYRQTVSGLAAQVALIAHETRHSEGNGYGHVSCCGIPGGCDQTYNEKDLSAYAIQYYLATQWLSGAINLGYSCDAQTRGSLAASFQSLANVYPARFCDVKPAKVTIPAAPGGDCIAPCSLMPSDFPNSTVPDIGEVAFLGVSASSATCGWTAESPDSWIFAVSGMNSAGSGKAAFGIAPNDSAAPRTGSLIAAGVKVPVTQAGCSQCTPPVTISSVVSGAPFSTAIQSGSWVTIYGTNLAGTTRQWNSNDFSGDQLPLSLDGVSVKIDGKPAAVYFISPTQLNVQSPANGATGQVQVQVANQQGTATGSAALRDDAPAFFAFEGKYVAAVHADGTLVGPAGLFGASTISRPASPGETVLLFGTGFGPTDPASAAGIIITSPAVLAFAEDLQIRVGGQAASVQFAGLTGVGLYQFNVVIPALPDGDSQVDATIDTVPTSGSLFIAIKKQ